MGYARAFKKTWKTPPGVFQAYSTYWPTGYLGHYVWASAWMCKVRGRRGEGEGVRREEKGESGVGTLFPLSRFPLPFSGGRARALCPRRRALLLFRQFVRLSFLPRGAPLTNTLQTTRLPLPTTCHQTPNPSLNNPRPPPKKKKKKKTGRQVLLPAGRRRLQEGHARRQHQVRPRLRLGRRHARRLRHHAGQREQKTRVRGLCLCPPPLSFVLSSAASEAQGAGPPSLLAFHPPDSPTNS